MSKWIAKKANEAEVLKNITDPESLKALITVLVNGNYIKNIDFVLSDYESYKQLQNVNNLINQDKDIDYVINYINKINIGTEWLEKLKQEKIQYVKDMYHFLFDEEMSDDEEIGDNNE